jgi:hypothetical protein
MDPRAALDELFTAALDAFVETRARLAAALIAAGQKAEGQALKKVRRPSPSAWATNQVVRRARPEVDAFLAASERLRESQGAIVAGHGERGLYQADVEELRRATGALSEAAHRTLGALGRPDDRAVVERVLANARAGALSTTSRDALLGGELVADLETGGDAFGGLFAGGVPAPGVAAAPRRAQVPHPTPAPPPREADARHEREADARREREADTRREREAREREEARAKELADARREEADARAAASASEETSTRARTALEDARGRAEEAQRVAREAERALRDAEAAAARAQREAAEAETRAGRATRRREGLER